MNCGGSDAFLINTRVVPDFDVSMLEPELRAAFADHMDGICCNCGMYQAYRRFTDEQLEQINELGKDVLTTDEVYESYPVPDEFVERFHARTRAIHIPRWRRVFKELGLVPREALFIRHWFGIGAEFVATEYGARISAIDMSDVCRRYVSERYPEFQMLDGWINGVLSGPFLESGPYNAVFTSHILCHACDVRRMLTTLKDFLEPGGFLVLEAETKVAPTNPFHMFYPSEFHVFNLLSTYFKEVYQCTDAGIQHQDDPRRYTGEVVEYLAIR